MTETATHESHPPKSTLERLISALSMHGVDPGKVSGGRPELDTGDWAGALSGSGDKLGEHVVCVRYLEHSPRKLIRDLHWWGMTRLIERDSELKISVREHKRLCALAVEQHAGWARMSRDKALERLRIGRSRYEAIRPHHTALVTRLVNGESRALEHLRRRVR
jgi:hypothetical protein